MAAIELAVGIIVATYLGLLAVVLTYFGFADLGADEREREFEEARTRASVAALDASVAD